MGFGDSVRGLIGKATDAAKAKVAALVDKGAQGVQYVKKKASEIAEVVEEKTSRAIDAGIRGAASGAGNLSEKGASLGRKASDAFSALKQKFTGKPPQQPCIPCSKKDIDYDGCLVGYKDGKCVPLTDKKKPGESLTAEEIAQAKQAGYDPRRNPASDPDLAHVPAKDRPNTNLNTSQAVSDCCTQCMKDKPPRTIFYVNGINTTHDTHCETLKAIGDMTCARVVGIYNATEGAVKDLNQASQDVSLGNQAERGRKDLAHDGRNPAVDTLSDLVVRETRAGRPPELFAHSQGGAITSTALYDARNTLAAGAAQGLPGPSDISDLKVTSFGSAAQTWPTGPSYTHYININDLTPRDIGLGENPARDAAHAGGGQVIRFSGEAGKDFTYGSGPLANGAKMDHHLLPGMTAYHGINDQMYFKAYKEVETKKAADAGKSICSCGKK